MAVKDMAASILTRLKTQAKETGLTLPGGVFEKDRGIEVF